MADHESLLCHGARSAGQVSTRRHRPTRTQGLLLARNYLSGQRMRCDLASASSSACSRHSPKNEVSKGIRMRGTRAPSPVAGRLDRFPSRHPEATTPFLMVDLDVVGRQYCSLTAALPGTEVFYAVKANPAPEILSLLISLGSNFDVASRGEIELCLGLGADPARLSYGNTVKKERDIAAAYRCGVRLFTVDSQPELDKVLRTVASGTVFVRIATDGAGADWPLSRKFGCTVGEAWQLLLQAARAGLRVGVSFHVGSQQRNPGAWDRPLGQVAQVARWLAASGYELAGVNLGGGLPSSHIDPTADIEKYGEAIAGSG